MVSEKDVAEAYKKGQKSGRSSANAKKRKNGTKKIYRKKLNVLGALCLGAALDEATGGGVVRKVPFIGPTLKPVTDTIRTKARKYGGATGGQYAVFAAIPMLARASKKYTKTQAPSFGPFRGY